MALIQNDALQAWLVRANVRSSQNDIATIRVADFLRHFGVRKLILRQGKERVLSNGTTLPAKKYLQALFGTDSRINLGIGQSVVLDARLDGVSQIEQLLLDYTLYTSDKLQDGTVLKYPWFSFGATADPNSGVIGERDVTEDDLVIGEQEVAPAKPQPKRRSLASARN